MITPDLLARLCRARAELQTQLELPPSVASVARRAGLSTAHFITQFRAVFGETPVQCRNRARMDLARQMLAGGTEPITQIGLALGFANMGSFSRAFQARFGIAPRTYRRTAAGASGSSPPGCIALMNHGFAALAGRNSGEVPRPGLRHHGALP